MEDVAEGCAAKVQRLSPQTPHQHLFQEGTGSVRFVSVLDFSKIDRFASVRFGQIYFPVRRGSACVFRTRRGSVRFGSVQFRVRFRPVPDLNGSVRPVRFGSVSYSFLPVLRSRPLPAA